MVALLLVWPKVSGAKLRIAVGAACVLACVVLARWRYFAPPRICVLDVGQGDAILVQQGAHAMLVDAGPGDAVAEALARCHVLHLDAAIVTHLHADHYEGLSALVGRMACDQVYVAKGVKPNIPNDIVADWRELTGKDPEEVAWGDVVNVGDFSMRVVWPEQPVAGDVNADSLEMLVSYDKDGRKLTALLTGDAEHLETGAVVDKGAVGDIDVLKVGHHGSSISIDERDAEALDPEVAVASAGEGNSYGHPDPTCVETLRKAGARFYCTKDVGDVEVTPGIEGPAVRVAHDTS
jgi:competence protein ComEC